MLLLDIRLRKVKSQPLPYPLTIFIHYTDLSHHEIKIYNPTFVTQIFMTKVIFLRNVIKINLVKYF
jgi:hypothetical protein